MTSCRSSVAPKRRRHEGRLTAVAAASLAFAALRFPPRTFVVDRGLCRPCRATISASPRRANAAGPPAEELKTTSESIGVASVADQEVTPEQTAADMTSAAAVAVAATAGSMPTIKGVSSQIRDRLRRDIEAQQAQVEAVPTEDQKRIVMQEVDLNGIDGVSTVLGSVPVAALSYGMWLFTNQAANYFLAHPVETDFYPVQRLAVAFQTAVVGLSSLAAGIFGFTAFGILLLGLRVTFGVLIGELDPSKRSLEPERQSTAEKVRDFLTLDPVEVALKQRKKREQASKP